jgi:hypothetical protein
VILLPISFKWFRKEPYRVVPRPDQIFQPIRGEFVGKVKLIGTRYSGLTYDTVHRVIVEKIVAFETIDDRTTELAAFRRVLRLGDKNLPFEIDGAERFDGLRDFVITACRRDPRGGSVRGTFVAERLVARPIPEVVVPDEKSSPEEALISEAVQEETKPLAPAQTENRWPTSSARADEPVSVSSTVVPRPIQPTAPTGAAEHLVLPAVNTTAASPSAPTFDNSTAIERDVPKVLLPPPRYILDGSLANPPLDPHVGIVRVMVRCWESGRPLHGTAQISDQQSPDVSSIRSFGESGLIIVGPPARMHLRISAPGYETIECQSEVLAANTSSLEVRLRPSAPLQKDVRVELVWGGDRALELHVLHVGEGQPAFHVSPINHGSLVTWPFVETRDAQHEAGRGHASAVFRRILPGRTFCIVRALDCEEASHPILESGAVVRLIAADGQVTQESFAPADSGNTWCALVLIGENPAFVEGAVTQLDRVSLNDVKRWDPGPLPSTASNPSVSNTAGYNPVRRGEWWILICAVIGLALTAFIATAAGVFGAIVMLAVAVAAVYSLYDAGYAFLPNSLRRRGQQVLTTRV